MAEGGNKSSPIFVACGKTGFTQDLSRSDSAVTMESTKNADNTAGGCSSNNNANNNNHNSSSSNNSRNNNNSNNNNSNSRCNNINELFQNNGRKSYAEKEILTDDRIREQKEKRKLNIHRGPLYRSRQAASNSLNSGTKPSYIGQSVGTNNKSVIIFSSRKVNNEKVKSTEDDTNSEKDRDSPSLGTDTNGTDRSHNMKTDPANTKTEKTTLEDKSDHLDLKNNDDESNNESSHTQAVRKSIDSLSLGYADSSSDSKDDTLDESTTTSTKEDQSFASSGSSMSPGKERLTSDSMAFSDPRQRQVFQTLTAIQTLRRAGHFSDILIRVKDKDFRCHRFVLSNSSPYFNDLLTGNLKRDEADEQDKSVDNQECENKEKENLNCDPTKGSKESEFVIKGVEPHIFEKVLDFIYCVYEDLIQDNTAVDLLLAASRFQLLNLAQTCVAHIAETVSVDNVFEIIRLIDSGCLPLCDYKVKLRCHQVFRENFLQLSNRVEFLGLSRQCLISSVADSMLAISSEMDLIAPLIRWVSVRPTERCADLTLMLQLIRFPLMTPENLDELLKIPFLKENSLAIALIEESRAYGMKDFPERMSWPRQNCISRCHFPNRDFILWTADRDKGLHLYSIIDGIHYKVSSFNEATTENSGFTFDSTSTVCCYGSKLYFTGGEFNTDLAWSVDSGTGEVKVLAKMPRGRKLHSMVVFRGVIYCLGGQDKRGYSVLDSVDAYIISKDLWLKVGHMAVAAYNMAAVISGGAIYLIGGVDNSGQPLRLIQCFAVLRSGLYSAFKVEISNMPPSLLGARAVNSGMDGSVYVVCGHGEVYCLDAEQKCLHHIKTLKALSQNPRVRFGLAHVGGFLVVTGGHQFGHVTQELIKSVCMDIGSKEEVKDYSPLLPANIVNTCFYTKLSSGILGFSTIASPRQ